MNGKDIQTKEELLRLKQMELLIREKIEKIENGKRNDPRHALMDARAAAETICRQVCFKSGLIKDPSPNECTPLDKLIQLIKQHKLAPAEIVRHLRTVQDYGNMAAHSIEPISHEAAEPALRALSNLVKWYFDSPFSSCESDGSYAEFPGNPPVSGSSQGVGTAVAVGAAVAAGIGGALLGWGFGKRKKKEEPIAG